jgi:hypothetical protein
MGVAAASQPAPLHPQNSGGEIHVRGRWLLIARVVWLAIAAFCLVVWIVGLPLNYADLGKVCTAQPCDQDPTPDSIARFHASGLTLGFYSSYIGTIVVVYSLIFLLVGALIFWRKSDTWIGLLTSLFLFTYGVAQSDSVDVIKGVPALAGPVGLLLPINFVCQGLFLYLFPDGRFAPRWARWVVLAWIPLFLLSSNVWPVGVFVPLLFGFLVVSLYAQVYRYQRVSTPTQRQQTKWVVLGVLIGILGFVGIIAIGALFGLGTSPGTFGFLWADTAVYVVTACIPLSFGIAILRSRLWDIDVIIRRTLIYGTLTTILAAVYFGVVISAQSLVQALTHQTRPQPVVIVATTLLIAALFHPLRRRLQAFIDRRFYRRKYDAARTLSAFGATLRAETDLAQLSGHLAAVVRETMQPTHVSLWLRQPERHPTDQAHRLEPRRQGPAKPNPD